MDRIQIFISYAREDAARVRAIYDKLTAAGFCPWLDREHILPGQKWEPIIKHELKRSDFVLVCLSSLSINKRGFLQKEIRQALEQVEEKLEEDIYLIPARLDDCLVPESLIEIQWVDLFADDGWEQLWRALRAQLPRLGKQWPSRSGELPTSPPSNSLSPQLAQPTPASLRSLPGVPKVAMRPFKFETVKGDAQGRIVQRREEQTRCFVENLGDRVVLEMVEVPGGEFLMGAPKDEESSFDSERPQHEVTVSPFYMGKFTVTQAQWRVVAGWTKIERDLEPEPSHFKGDDRPVEQVSWEDATEFCARLAKKTERAYRLPTEAEWEYACRAGTTTPFAFGETITPEFVNYDGNHPYGKAAKGKYREETVPAGSLGAANALGLFDMHGNVWEWCQDVWHGNYESAPNDGSAWEEGEVTERRVLRGGSWVGYGCYCRSAFRDGLAPAGRGHEFGLRVVVSARTQ